MKRAAALMPLFVAGCASGQTTSDSGPIEAPCRVTDCFFDRDIRDFDVTDRNTVVVYVGRQRCPFVVELQDVTCDMTFAPAIEFFQTALGRSDRLAPLQTGRICASTRGLVLYAGIPAPALLQQQDVFESRAGARPSSGFPRSDPFEGSFPVDPSSNDVCRVSDIRSINDDQLVELLAEVNAPPPPVGEGELEVEAPEEQEAGEPADGSPESAVDEGSEPADPAE